MVDFGKRLKKGEVEKKVDPIEIYDHLDRISEKGPLRSAQEAILEEWHSNFRSQRDVILKLHTGQGKTLVGLLLLQSKMNEKSGPAIYLCPNLFLVAQTVTQAEQFGLSVVQDESSQEFLEGKKILVTTVQKLFNGKTKFGLGKKSLQVNYIVLDDSHSCIDIINDACKLRFSRESITYQKLITLFESDLRAQGAGSFGDIKNGIATAMLPIPYWAWIDRSNDVTDIISANMEDDASFAWQLVKNSIRNCNCFVSGTYLEICPNRPPLEQWGSFFGASHRVFMSATVSNDSFFVKGLGLDPKTVKSPLVYRDEAWSGEKMIVIPSEIDNILDRSEIVKFFATSKQKGFGVVAIVPSFAHTKDWAGYKVNISRSETLDEDIKRLKEDDAKDVLVVVNRYDGIDLPDNACRILILDGRPFSESLADRYSDSCRSGSAITHLKFAQKVEQGMGRGVRGEKDYCAIVLIGESLVRSVRSKTYSHFYSEQTRKQIKIGLMATEYAREELDNNQTPLVVFKQLLNQLLRRDEGWKDFYIEQMNELELDLFDLDIDEALLVERKTEEFFEKGEYEKAVTLMQGYVDRANLDQDDKGWYLQQMARLIYPVSKTQSLKFQKSAHNANPFVLKPESEISITQLSPIASKRAENIIGWIRQFEDHSPLMNEVLDIASNLRFGVDSELFEDGVDRFGKAMGFVAERPDKKWKEGPDNLLGLRDGEFLLIECKNEVLETRVEINKHESGQMNNAIAWFDRNYKGVKSHRWMIIPAKALGSASGFNQEVKLLRMRGLQKLTGNFIKFFREFSSSDLQDLQADQVVQLLRTHHLDVDSLLSGYVEVVKEPSKTLV